MRAIHANLFGGGSHRCAVSRRGRSYLCSSFLVDSLCQSAQCSCCFTSIEHSACQVPTQHGSTSSQTCVVHKCQLFTQVITKAMILCKYSRCFCRSVRTVAIYNRATVVLLFGRLQLAGGWARRCLFPNRNSCANQGVRLRTKMRRTPFAPPPRHPPMCSLFCTVQS